MTGEPWTRERLAEECSRVVADIQQDAALVAKLPARMRRDIDAHVAALRATERSEEHTSELQSLMRISYAVFCLKKKKTTRESISCLTIKDSHLAPQQDYTD